MSGEPYISDGRDALLADLNPVQREAVVHAGGPLLVVAGAGTGKTRVLTRRVAWLVAGGLPARALLAITFTNKAADVLRERLGGLLFERRGVWAGTFHAFCAWVLRIGGEAIGIRSDYTVLDREDQRRLLKDLLADAGLARGALTPAEASAMISHVKNGSGGKAPLDLSDPDVEALFENIAKGYTERLKAGNLLDFDDLLLEGRRLLTEDEETGNRFRQRFAHVLVDEYQDTNVVQAELLGALLGPSQNLTAVGDPDQSIYRWRGAAVRNILEFEADYPGARTILLERNYRSTKHILDAAEHVIEKNEHRHAKRLYTEREPGAPVRVIACRDPEDEAEAVADRLLAWQQAGHALGDMAVFYRVNSLSRALELALRTRDIPYLIVAGVEFFQRREVKDLLAYARLVENPFDEAAFLRIVNVPRRGVGAKSITKLRHAAIDAGISTLEAARRGLGGVSGRAKQGLTRLLAVLDEVRALPRSPVGPVLDRLAESSGYRAWLTQQDDVVELSRTDNVDELVSFAHANDQKDPGATLQSFLERTALVSDQDGYEETPDRVNLMSVHAAKGLEFDCVVIAGAESELFPHARSIGDVAGEEEERRLFYVAMTRAKQRLAVTYATVRFDWRGSGRRFPSPYLHDIPPALIETEERRPRWSVPREPGFFDDTWTSDDDSADVVRESDAPLAVGDRVRHPYFGEGWVADQRGQSGEARVTVDFDQHGRKQLLLRHARLERVL